MTFSIYQVSIGGITPWHKGTYHAMRDAYAQALDLILATGGRVMILTPDHVAAAIFTGKGDGTAHSQYGTLITDKDDYLCRIGFNA